VLNINPSFFITFIYSSKVITFWDVGRGIDFFVNYYLTLPYFVLNGPFCFDLNDLIFLANKVFLFSYSSLF